MRPITCASFGHRASVLFLTSALLIASLAAALFVESSSAATKAKTTTTTTTNDPGRGLEKVYVRVVKALRPSVVEISTDSGLGSGVIFDHNGNIVTNAHVVGSATTFTVSFTNGTSQSGRLVATYVPDDLAIIQVGSPKGLKPAHFGNLSLLEVGDIVLAMGNPLGLSSSVTDGIVSFNGRGSTKVTELFFPTLSRQAPLSIPGTAEAH